MLTTSRKRARAWLARRRFAAYPVHALRLKRKFDGGDGGAFARYVASIRPPEFVRGMALRLMLIDGVKAVTFEHDDMRWQTDLGDEIGFHLYLTGQYEGPEISAVLDWLRLNRPQQVMIDIGANIGTTSVPFALAGYTVVAVEPVPATFDMLKSNVRMNALESRVNCVQSAISEQSGVLEMWTGDGSGQAEVAVPGREPAATRWGGAGRIVEVESRPLHEILLAGSVAAHEVALVWADVQGAETAVIRTATDLWTTGVPLYCEVDPTSLELQVGVEAFVDEVVLHFNEFVTRDDLLRGRYEPQPISSFRSWVGCIGAVGSTAYSDVLLIPTI